MWLVSCCAQVGGLAERVVRGSLQLTYRRLPAAVDRCERERERQQLGRSVGRSSCGTSDIVPSVRARCC